MRTHIKAVNAVNVALWLGAAAFLIWFVVTELVRSSDDTYLINNSEHKSYLRFPGAFVCPTLEAFSIFTEQPALGARVTLPATVDEDGPASGDKSYSLCPRVVNFTGPGNRTVQCLDFEPSIKERPFSLSCDPHAASAYYMVAPDGFSPARPFTAPDASATLYLAVAGFGFKTQPLMVQLYSAQTARDRPASFAEYSHIFSLAQIEQVYLPLNTLSVAHIDKYVRNAPGSNAQHNCDTEYFDASTSVLTTPINDGNSTDEMASYQQIFLTYNTLRETHQCNRKLYTYWDALGIIGGAIGIVLAVTMFLMKLAKRVMEEPQGDAHHQYLQDYSAM